MSLKKGLQRKTLIQPTTDNSIQAYNSQNLYPRQNIYPGQNIVQEIKGQYSSIVKSHVKHSTSFLCISVIYLHFQYFLIPVINWLDKTKYQHLPCFFFIMCPVLKWFNRIERQSYLSGDTCQQWSVLQVQKEGLQSQTQTILQKTQMYISQLVQQQYQQKTVVFSVLLLSP